MRRDAWVPGLPTHQLPEVTRYYDPQMREALVMWHRFSPADTLRVLERELIFFARAAALTWKVYAGDEPANLADALMAHGFKPEGEHALMVCAAEDMAAVPMPASRMEVRALSSRADLDLVAKVWDDAFPEGSGNWVEVMRDALTQRPDLLKMFVGLIDGEPVTTAYAMLDPRGTFAYLGGGATVAAYRGQGLYRTLVQTRARLVHAAGIRCLVVEAGVQSRRVLEQLGFHCATQLVFYERPGGEGVGAATPAETL